MTTVPSDKIVSMEDPDYCFSEGDTQASIVYAYENQTNRVIKVTNAFGETLVLPPSTKRRKFPNDDDELFIINRYVQYRPSSGCVYKPARHSFNGVHTREVAAQQASYKRLNTSENIGLSPGYGIRAVSQSDVRMGIVYAVKYSNFVDKETDTLLVEPFGLVLTICNETDVDMAKLILDNRDTFNPFDTEGKLKLQYQCNEGFFGGLYINDPDGTIGKRFINFLGQVYEVDIKRDRRIAPGVWLYVNTRLSIKDERTRSLPIDEVDKLTYLFKSEAEAKLNNSDASALKAQLDINKFTSSEKAEESKAEAERSKQRAEMFKTAKDILVGTASIIGAIITIIGLFKNK